MGDTESYRAHTLSALVVCFGSVMSSGHKLINAKDGHRVAPIQLGQRSLESRPCHLTHPSSQKRGVVGNTGERRGGSGGIGEIIVTRKLRKFNLPKGRGAVQPLSAAAPMCWLAAVIRSTACWPLLGLDGKADRGSRQRPGDNLYDNTMAPRLRYR